MCISVGSSLNLALSSYSYFLANTRIICRNTVEVVMDRGLSGFFLIQISTYIVLVQNCLRLEPGLKKSGSLDYASQIFRPFTTPRNAPIFLLQRQFKRKSLIQREHG